MTPWMARTDSAAGPLSTRSPAWLESTVWWTPLVESAAKVVLGACPAGSVEGLRGGEHREWTVAQGGECLGLGEDIGEQRRSRHVRSGLTSPVEVSAWT